MVHAGQVLARLDPTFATADMGALVAQVSTLQAQVSRMQAEIENRPFTYTGLDPNMAFQASIYGQRQAEFNFKLENYRQKAGQPVGDDRPRPADIANYGDRLAYAKTLETDAQGSGASERRLENQHAVGNGYPGRDAGNLDNAQQQADRAPSATSPR